MLVASTFSVQGRHAWRERVRRWPGRIELVETAATRLVRFSRCRNELVGGAQDVRKAPQGIGAGREDHASLPGDP